MCTYHFVEWNCCGKRRPRRRGHDLCRRGRDCRDTADFVKVAKGKCNVCSDQLEDEADDSSED
ncbi:uncharacterized protein RCO7_15205 [Rhynchosporium graminicola]|uniref:Uncharacterized protein n=1 Tax=Rhynchosporium graminicola TaxID=2792576 RepID=A0A1E1LQY1_9HELO|nr:uncharacterized protein RCO7_15205 [Rhynchosporium commune]